MSDHDEVVVELDDADVIAAKLDQIIDLLTHICNGTTPKRPAPTPEQVARDVATLRAMRVPQADGGGEFPTSTTTRERFYDPRSGA